MSDNAQAQFVQTLQDIVDKARKNNDTIRMDEIMGAFEGMDLPVEQMEEIYEHIRNQNIIVIQGKGPEDSLDGERPGALHDQKPARRCYAAAVLPA